MTTREQSDSFLGQKCVCEQLLLTSMCFLNLQKRKALTTKQINEATYLTAPSQEPEEQSQGAL
jgi:hypothetical protein